MNISTVIILAVLSESAWETIKMTWQKGKISIDRIGAFIISLLIVISTGFDILEFLGLPCKMPGIGIVLSSVLLSRGSNFMHDLIIKVTDNKIIKETKKE